MFDDNPEPSYSNDESSESDASTSHNNNNINQVEDSILFLIQT